MSKIRVGNKQNAYFNGEYAGHVRKWGKKFTQKARRSFEKELIRKEVSESEAL